MNENFNRYVAKRFIFILEIVHWISYIGIVQADVCDNIYLKISTRGRVSAISHEIVME